MCTFKGYKKEYIYCECSVKLKFNSFLNFNITKSNLVHRFKLDNKIISNYWVLKCYERIFTKEAVKNNICSIIILGIIGIDIICYIIFKIKGFDILYNKIIILIKSSFKKVTFALTDKNELNDSDSNKIKITNNNINNNKKIKFIGNFRQNNGLYDRSSKHPLNLINSNQLNNNILRKKMEID